MNEDDETWCLFEGQPAEVPAYTARKRRRTAIYLGHSAFDLRHSLAGVCRRLGKTIEGADALGTKIPAEARETFLSINDRLAVSDRYNDEDHEWVEGLRRLAADERDAHSRYAWLAKEACQRYIRRMAAEEKAEFRFAKSEGSQRG